MMAAVSISEMSGRFYETKCTISQNALVSMITNNLNSHLNKGCKHYIHILYNGECLTTLMP
jgi:hypothetical protein